MDSYCSGKTYPEAISSMRYQWKIPPMCILTFDTWEGSHPNGTSQILRRISIIIFFSIFKFSKSSFLVMIPKSIANISKCIHHFFLKALKYCCTKQQLSYQDFGWCDNSYFKFPKIPWKSHKNLKSDEEKGSRGFQSPKSHDCPSSGRAPTKGSRWRLRVARRAYGFWSPGKTQGVNDRELANSVLELESKYPKYLGVSGTHQNSDHIRQWMST